MAREEVNSVPAGALQFAAPRSSFLVRRMVNETHIHLKRAYDPPSLSDGVRILVDRLWPRGVRKADAAIDRWLKEIAPSTELRRWFGHEPSRWDEFRRRYRVELSRHKDELDELRAIARKGQLTLIYAARDQAHNEAVVLRDVLAE